MSSQQAFAHLLLPGLFPLSRDQTQSVPLLSRVLARATQHMQQSSTLPLAAFSYLHDFASLPKTNCWRCDPVYLQADATKAIIFEFPVDEVSIVDSTALVEAFNTHFADQDLALEYAEPGRWYLQGLVLPESCSSVPPALQEISGCNLQPLLDRTAGINSLLTEIQMLFFEHPVNQQRELQGRLPINGVWIYGAGPLPAKEDIQWDLIVSDSAIYKGMAKYADIACVSPEQGLENESVIENQRIFLHIDSMLTTRTEGLERWLAELKIIEEKILQPLWRAVRQGRLQHFIIDDGAGTQYKINRLQSFCFWRQNYKYQTQ